VVRRRVWDVAADILRGSSFFGSWAGIGLSATHRGPVWVPPGFANGFLSLEVDTHLAHKASDACAKQCERSIRWDAPTPAIA